MEQGSRVLDIACGYGEPALTAARKAAPDGTVVATDSSGAEPKLVIDFATGRKTIAARFVDVLE